MNNNLGINLGLSITPAVKFLSLYKDSWNDYFWEIDYLSTEISPKGGVEFQKVEIGILGRIWQHRKIDHLINKNAFSNEPSEIYTKFNPLKIGLYFEYNLGHK